MTDQFKARMEQLFDLKYASNGPVGWSPRLRHEFGHFTPDDYYEAVVESLVDADSEWLDVGGGSTILHNPALARMLADRCKRLVVVDPSSNVNQNPFAHERHQKFLEDFHDSRQFTLATARMVVEHVAAPEKFVAKLGQLVKPGGKTVVYTVNRWSPITVVSGCTPIGIHHFVKKMLWGTEEKDTFPVTYLMNTRSRLNALFTAAGFRETRFQRLDDCRTLARWRATTFFELAVWKALRTVGIGYPEACLLGVYERKSA